MKKNDSFLYLLIGLMLCMAPSQLSAQVVPLDSSQRIMVSPVVGLRIDAREKQAYRILEDYPKREFIYAEVYPSDPGLYLLRVMREEGQLEDALITRADFLEMKAEIEKQYPGWAAYQTLDTAGTELRLELLNGDLIQGTFIRKTEPGLVLSTNYGEVAFALEDISDLRLQAGEVRKGKYFFPNPHKTRYLFAPSAIPLKKGEGYYQNTMVVFNAANVGVTDNISVGGGLEIISTLSGNPIFFVTSRAGFQVAPKAYVGGGLLIGGIAGFDTGANFGGIFFANTTYGSIEKNITVGVGMPFAFEGGLADVPLINVSGMARVGRRVALVSENYILPFDGEVEFVFSAGPRLMGEKFAVDIALATTPELITSGGIPAIPFVDVVFKF